jgi:photosystem II stability/assembly factor-like uncharacterized protein
MKMSSIRFKKVFLSLILLLIFLGIVPDYALAHRPHDDVTEIELSPNYQEDKTLFIVVRSNLFKSTDGGEHWERIVKGITSPSDISGLSMSKTDKNILFLSTEKNGIFKSENEGQSWQSVNSGLKTQKIKSVLVSHANPNLVFATGANGGLYKSDNGGKVWQLLFDEKEEVTAIADEPTASKLVSFSDAKGNIYFAQDQGNRLEKISTVKSGVSVTSIAFSPQFIQDKTIYLGTEKQGLLQSSDGGKTWAEITPQLSKLNIRDIVFLDKNSASKIMVSTWHEGPFISEDAGKTWKKIDQGLTIDHQAEELKEPNFSDLEISNGFAQDKTMFVAGFNGFFKTTDGGNSWKELESLSTGTITSLAISPNYQKDSTLAIVTYVGNIYLSQDAGKTWKPINNGLEVPRLTKSFEKPNQDPRRFFDISFSPNYANDRSIFATLLWDNFLKTDNQGEAWQIVGLPSVKGSGLRGLSIVPSPNFAQDKTIYLATQYGVLLRSTDGGNQFKAIAQLKSRKANEATSLVISPDYTNDHTLFISAAKGIYKSVDDGESWQQMTENSPLADRYFYQLVISPNFKQDQTLISGTEQGVFLSQDAGKSWQQLQTQIFNQDGYIEGITISPNYPNDRTFMLSVRGEGVFKTSDGGKTFQQLEKGSLPVALMNSVPSAGKSIQFSPNYAQDNTLFAFGSATTQVFKSTDAGTTWQVLSIPDNSLEPNYDMWTRINLIVLVYRLHVLKTLSAVAVALLAYFTLGFLNLEKKLPLHRGQIKFAGAFLAFIITLTILFKFI